MMKTSLLLAIGLLMPAAIAHAGSLDWAWPGAGDDGPAIAGNTVHRLPGSPHRYTAAAIADLDHAPDWYPREHPRAPRVVLDHAGGACGYCHLVTGAGRSENAQLRGQPVEYIEEQVKAFASGARRSAGAEDPTSYMIAAAQAVSAADLRAAARYFAALEPVRHAHVIEAVTIPRAVAKAYLYQFDPRAREALGQRIIEGPVRFEQHSLRDPHEATVAYVPVGAIARGAALANHGSDTVTACVTCHTRAFVGIAGDSPTYLVRQLAGFRSHARNDPGAAPMQAVAAGLSDNQIIDLAAYIGSRPPWTRAQMRASFAESPPRN